MYVGNGIDFLPFSFSSPGIFRVNCSLSCTDVLPKMMCLCNHSNEGKQKFEFQASVKDIQTSYLTEWKKPSSHPLENNFSLHQLAFLFVCNLQKFNKI
jgi:hypothetical protein